jgi:hypothetical protein
VTRATQDRGGVPHGQRLIAFAEAVLGEASADFRASLGIDRFDVGARV